MDILGFWGNVIGKIDSDELVISGQKLGYSDIALAIMQAQYFCVDKPIKLAFRDCEFLEAQQGKGGDLYNKYKLVIPAIMIKTVEVHDSRILHALMSELYNFEFSSGERYTTIPDNIESFDLSGCKITQGTATTLEAFVKKCPKLTKMNFSSCGINSEEAVQWFKKIIEFSHVHEVEFADNTTDAELDARIRSVVEDVKNGYIIEYAPGYFVTVPVISGTLDLSNMYFEKGLDKAEASPQFKNFIEAVHRSKASTIKCNRPITDLFCSKLGKVVFLREKESIKCVNFANCRKDGARWPEGPYEIARLLTRFPNTEVLILDGNDFKGVWIEGKYLGGHFDDIIMAASKVKRLSLSGCNIADEDIFCDKPYFNYSVPVHLTAGSAWHQLSSLNLSGNNLTDACAQKLAQWLSTTSITDLDIRGNGFTQEAAAMIEAVIVSNANGQLVTPYFKGRVEQAGGAPGEARGAEAGKGIGQPAHRHWKPITITGKSNDAANQ